MKLFETLLTSPAVQVFGWALLHSLWQGFILAILLRGVLNLSKFSANTRYLLACATLLLMLLLPVSTSLWSGSEAQFTDPSGRPGLQVSVPAENATSPEPSGGIVLPEAAPSYKLWIHQAERDFMPWVVLVWSFGVFISSLKLLGIWTYTQRLKQNEKHLVLEQCRETLEKLSRQLRVSRPVILLQSSLVHVPTVIGWIKPMILVPSCALTGLTRQQMELILAHELAHIKRHDYLVNLLQTVIETFLFYHPAVWWVSGQIRSERENACDDLAVSVSGDALVYARTLIEMERLRKTAPSLAMAADGGGSGGRRRGGSLTNRIHRLVGAEMSHSKRFAGLWAVIFIGLFMVTVGVTKQNSSVIKERARELLSLNLSSVTDPEAAEGMIEGSKAQNTEENRKNKKPAEEENTKAVPASESETDLNVKPDAKENAVAEQNADQNLVGNAPQTNPTLPLPESSTFPLTGGPSPEVSSLTDENVGSQVNIKYQREAGPETQDGSQDFIEEMASVGYTNLSVNELISLKAVGVTANYVRGLRALGFNNLTVKELTSLRAVGVTPAFIEGIRNAGYKELTIKELTSFSALGVTPEYISKLRSAGYDNLPVKSLTSFSANGVTVDFINRMNGIGFGKLSPKDLVSLRVFNITPDFIRTARSRLGNDLTIKQIIDLKNMGILKDKDKDKDDQ